MAGRIFEGARARHKTGRASNAAVRIPGAHIWGRLNFYPVILAGGRGTRFWPLSRRRRAKQLLALDGKQTMIRQMVARLSPLAAESAFWIITNEDSRPEIVRQLPRLAKSQILAEPIGRNTAPAIGLAAFILNRSDPDAVIGLFHPIT